MKKIPGLTTLLLCLISAQAEATVFTITSDQYLNSPTSTFVGSTFTVNLSPTADGTTTTFSASTVGKPAIGTTTFSDPSSAFESIPGSGPYGLTGMGLQNPMTINNWTFLDDAVSFTIDALGNIVSGSIRITEDHNDFFVTILNGTFSGQYNADFGPCFFDPGCQFTGTYPTVPEPPSFALLLTGVFGMGWFGVKRAQPG